MTVSRRSFIIATGGVVAGGVAVVLGVMLRSESDPPAMVPEGAADRLGAFFSDAEGARRLGDDHLATSSMGGRRLAASLVPAGQDPEVWFADTGDEEFAHHLRDLVGRDFAAGDLAIVRGWRLASSEANACALWSLT